MKRVANFPGAGRRESILKLKSVSTHRDCKGRVISHRVFYLPGIAFRAAISFPTTRWSSY